MSRAAAAAPSPMTAAQRRAIFAAAHAKGLLIDDLRALTPAGSVSMMTQAQAAAVLDRLNDRPDPSRDRKGVGARPAQAQRRPRKPEGVIRLVSAEQKALITSIRLELGWTEAQLSAWLQTRHYRYDPSRKMDRMDSTADAVAVIELLKAVRDRTFAGQTRPHKRQLWTITDRLARIRRARGWSKDHARAWARSLKLRDGREAHAFATAADASEVIDILTRELARCEQSRDRKGAVEVDG